jgi:hypothetical protein
MASGFSPIFWPRRKMKNMTFRKFLLIFVLLVFCLILLSSGTARSEWKGDMRVNLQTSGKQAVRGLDCPWSISVGEDDRVHVVWEDRRHGYPLRIYYRGKDPDPTWMKWDSYDYELSTIDTVVMFGHPSIHAQSNGKVFAVYVEERPFGGELYGSWIEDHASRIVQSDMVSDPGGFCLSFSSQGWQTTIASYEDRTITFWPYANYDQAGSLPIFFRIYDDGIAVTEERPIELPGIGLAYRGVNLSATSGSDNKVYLACRVTNESFPLGHIYLFTMDLRSGDILNIENLTPGETRNCGFPYVDVSRRPDGNDLIFITFEMSGPHSKAVFTSNIAGEWSELRALTSGDNSSGRPCVTVNGEFADFVYESPCNSPQDFTQIYHQRYDWKASTLSEAVRVTSPGEYYNMRPVIDADSYGNLHVVYISNRDHPQTLNDEEVYYSVFDASPSTPDGFGFDRHDNIIYWRDNPEPDISHYEVDFNGRDTILYENHLFIENYSFDDFIICVKAIDLSGQESRTAVFRSTSRGLKEISGNPADLFVGENYPNPFNSSTTIPISSINSAFPQYLEIYDITGQLVKTFTIRGNNRQEVVWNGKNDYVRPVSTGVYFYRLRSGSKFGKTKSMTLLK